MALNRGVLETIPYILAHIVLTAACMFASASVPVPVCTYNGTACQASPLLSLAGTAIAPVQRYLQRWALETVVCSSSMREETCMMNKCSWNVEELVPCTLTRDAKERLILAMHCNGSAAHHYDSCRLFGSGGAEQCRNLGFCEYMMEGRNLVPGVCLPDVNVQLIRNMRERNVSEFFYTQCCASISIG